MKNARLIFPVVTIFALSVNSLLVSCAPATTPLSAASAQPAAEPGQSPVPTPTPDASASPGATVSANPAPAATVSATPGTAPAPSGSPVPSTSPEPILNYDPSTDKNTTFNGKVFDFEGNPLEGVKVVARSLSSSSSFERETVTKGGSYSFNNAPAGIQIEIVASLAGYASRRRVEVLKSNTDGTPQLNRYDFGTDGSPGSTGSAITALDDSPEVIKVTPGRGASGVDPGASISLSFSEAMDPESVEDTFSIRAYSNTRFSVDKRGEGFSFVGDGKLETVSNDLIYDINAFEPSWNSDKTQLTLSFKDQGALPTDTLSSEVPDYQIVFNTAQGRRISDADGKSRASLHFHLSDSSLEESCRFSVKPDQTAPKIGGMDAVSAESGNEDGDALRISYNEPMIYETLARDIAGGLEDRSDIAGSQVAAPAGHPAAVSHATARGAAENYAVFIDQGGGETVNMSWAELGGSVVYDREDDSNQTVLLQPPQQGSLSSTVTGAPLQGDAITATARLKTGEDVTLGTLTMQTQSDTLLDHVTAGTNITLDADETLTIVYSDGSSDSGVDLSNPAANTYAELIQSLGTLSDDGPADWSLLEFQSGGAINGDGNVGGGDRLDVALDDAATRNGKQIAWIELSGGIFAADKLNLEGYRIVTSPLRAVQAALNAGFDLSGGRFSLSETDAAAGAGVLATGDGLGLSLGSSVTVDSQSVLFVTIAAEGLFGPTRLNAPAAGYLVYPGTAAGESVDIFESGSLIEVTVASTVTDPAGNSIDTSASRVTESAD